MDDGFAPCFAKFTYKLLSYERLSDLQCGVAFKLQISQTNLASSGLNVAPGFLRIRGKLTLPTWPSVADAIHFRSSRLSLVALRWRKLSPRREGYREAEIAKSYSRLICRARSFFVAWRMFQSTLIRKGVALRHLNHCTFRKHLWSCSVMCTRFCYPSWRGGSPLPRVEARKS